MAPERRLFGGASPGSGNARDLSPYSQPFLGDEHFEEDGLSDVHMATRRAEEAAIRRFQAARWLQDMLGSVGLPEEPSEEELRLSLKNGIVLCNLLNKVHDGLIPKIVQSPVPTSPADGVLSAYQYFENVRNFLVAIEEMKLPSFEASDLSEAGSLSKVVDSILALKSYYEWREGKGFSPWKFGAYKHGSIRSPSRSLEDAYRLDEPTSTPSKTTHTRKRWAIPDFADASEMSVQYETSTPTREKSPMGHSNGFYNDAENLASPAARLHQIGQKFREVLQVKRLQDLQTSDLDPNSNIKGQPLQSLPTLVKSIISDKQPDEIPVLVEFMMKKVLEEFERRLRIQADQVKRLKFLHKELMGRESKLQSRAKVLEALAAGSGEEIKLITQQLQQTKMEKKRLEDEKRNHEENVVQLVKERDEKQNIIETLRKELALMSDEQKRQQALSLQNEKQLMEYKLKVTEMEKRLEESYNHIQSFETSVAEERKHFNERENKYKQIISVQSQAIEDLKHTSESLRAGALDMQYCWQEQLSKLENELTGLTDAAQAYHDVLAENRRLYNEVQDLKGNIRVYCRVRPFLAGQKEQATCVDFVGDNGEIMIANTTKQGKDSSKMFNFNKVYGPQAAQEEVFLDAQALIRSVLDGYNVCIFAYGQTGSGKTYTMTGPSTACKEDWGVNYRALYDLFQICQNRKNAFSYEVGVQMIEIYNEQVRDLLASDGVSKRLGIRNCSSTNGLHVPDAVMIPVASSEDVLEIMAVGQRNRAVGATALNERSSRSHSVLTVHVQGTDLAKGSILRGCLHLVDLAGSERVERSEATGDRLKEAQHINKSLSALGDVIAALAQKSSHIPYRNSKLTQLLQHSLGGQAKALMFVHINPDTDSYGETISTLKFAERVSSVELGAARTHREAGEIREFKEQIVALKEMLAKKDAEIERLHVAKRNSIETEKQRLKALQSNRLSFDNKGRKTIDLRPSEVSVSLASRASSRDPSPDQMGRASVTSRGSSRDPSPDEAVRNINTQIPVMNFDEFSRNSEAEENFVVYGNSDEILEEHRTVEKTYEDPTIADLSDASQDSLSSDHSSQVAKARPKPDLPQTQIPRPPRSERKLLPSSYSGLRRLSEIPSLDDPAKRNAKASSSVRASGALLQNPSGKASKRWL